jgi:hypothetical protein
MVGKFIDVICFTVNAVKLGIFLRDDDVDMPRHVGVK